MATETPTKIAYQLKLNNGTTEQGNLKTVNVSLGRMSLSGFNLDKAYALSMLLEPCLDKSLHTQTITRSATVSSI